MLIVTVLIALFSTCIIKYYMKIFLEPYEKRSKLWVLYIFWQIYVSVFEGLPDYLNLIINIGLIFVICYWSFEGSAVVKLVLTVLYNGMWLLMELILGSIFILMNIEIGNNQLIGSILSKILLFLLIIIIGKVFNNKSFHELPMLYSVLLLTIPLGSMYIIYNIFVICAEQRDIWQQIYLIFSSCIILVINIAVFKIYLKMSEDLETKHKNAIYTKQIAIYEQYMKEKTDDLEFINLERHNIKQKYILMKNLLQGKAYTELEEMLNNSMEDSFIHRKGLVNTNNIVIDSIVNYKYMLALKDNIDFKAEIAIPTQIDISSEDLCVLLGNLLDNSLEAAHKVKWRGYIFCKINYSSGNLMIRIINSYDGKLKKDKNGRIISSKKDNENHGIGLYSVSKIVEKYDGIINYELKDKEFIVDVLLYEKSYT